VNTTVYNVEQCKTVLLIKFGTLQTVLGPIPSHRYAYGLHPFFFFCSLVKKGKWEYTCSMHIVFILSLFWHQQIPFFVHKLDMGLYVLPVSWMPIVGVLDSQTSKIVRCKCLLHQYAPVRYWSCLAQLIFSFFTNLSKSSAKHTVSAAAY
jgi:hypothetical protein